MNFMQVLASCGLPNLRAGGSAEGSETWTYYARDGHTKKVLSYELVFSKNELSNWIIGAAGPGLLNPDDLTGLPTVGVTPVEDPASSSLQKRP
jgi:hypothetical protein